MGGILFSVIACLGFVCWDSFLRHEAYGTVRGRVVEIPPPWPGTVKAVYVQEGQHVQQGDIVATLSSIDLTESIDALVDEWRVAKAELDAEVAKLSLDAQVHQDRTRKALADYYELAGELLAEKADYQILVAKHDRTLPLLDKQVISEDSFDSVKLAKTGQSDKIQQLEQAVAELKSRADAAQQPVEDDQRLKPKLARIEQVQARILRLRERLNLGVVRAPVPGRVITIHQHVGEYVQPEKPLVGLLREGTLEVVVFARQQKSGRYKPGTDVRVVVDPHSEPLKCTIVRLGDSYEPAPASIETRYKHAEKLRPVFLRPANPQQSPHLLVLGSEVRVPSQWSW